MVKLSIASWSFHRLLESGQQDMFKYITDCKDLGATQLDPWNGHLAPLIAGDHAMKAGLVPNGQLSAAEKAYLAQVKAAAEETGLPFGCLAVDGAHIYEATPEARALNRAVAYRWLEAASLLGASTDTRRCRRSSRKCPMMCLPSSSRVIKISSAGRTSWASSCSSKTTGDLRPSLKT